jgi:hypothetical protein
MRAERPRSNVGAIAVLLGVAALTPTFMAPVLLPRMMKNFTLTTEKRHSWEVFFLANLCGLCQRELLIIGEYDLSNRAANMLEVAFP